MLAFVDLLVVGVLGCFVAGLAVVVCAVAALRELVRPAPAPRRARPRIAQPSRAGAHRTSTLAPALETIDERPDAPAVPDTSPLEVTERAGRDRGDRLHLRHQPRRSLPAGAEAALRSIVEVVPGPRNTLAMEKDPTAEVRVTSIDEVGNTDEVMLSRNGRHLLAR